MNQTRRLAAILAADVAGYSRLMGADEEGTLERLKALRHELVDPKITKHHGRIVKTTGDGLLVEFASVVDAVRCTVEVQQAIPQRNTSVGVDSRFELCTSPEYASTWAALARIPGSFCAAWSARRARSAPNTSASLRRMVFRPFDRHTPRSKG
jgi:hypothetical protein